MLKTSYLSVVVDLLRFGVCTHVHLLSKAGNRKLKDLCSIIARVLVKGDVSAGDGSSRQVPGLHPGPRPRGHQQMVSQNCHQRCCGPSGPVYGWTVVKPLYGWCLDCCILSWVEISELFTGAEGLSQIKSSPPPSCHGSSLQSPWKLQKSRHWWL